MPDPLAGLPPRFLRTPEAARFLGLSGRTRIVVEKPNSFLGERATDP